MSNTSASRNSTQMVEVLSSAGRNASGSGQLALASAEVVMRRMALGGSAMLNPAKADHGEFARMVPEKARAFTDAGKILFGQAALIGQECARFAAEEVMIAARSAAGLMFGAGPAGFLAGQSAAAIASAQRFATQTGAICLMALTAQAEAMASIHRVAADNVDRLRT